jgi:hypothetical protein
MINFSEISDGEQWELFARDFLQEFGFFIEQSPDRGSDGGKDMLVTERLKGNLGKYEFRWLVSCKHFAGSQKSVGGQDEVNIQERLDSFHADGFIGFYSTLASSGLNTRLVQLRAKGNIKDFRIFDHQLIENYLLRVGYSELMMRYMPDSYKQFSPLRLVENDYRPLKCQACGEDILKASYEKPGTGLVLLLRDYEDDTKTNIQEVYWCCKGECDRILKARKEKPGLTTSWNDISTLFIPRYFLDWIFANFDKMRNGSVQYTEKAYEDLIVFILAISQRVMRETTEKEKELVDSLRNSFSF